MTSHFIRYIMLAPIYRFKLATESIGVFICTASRLQLLFVYRCSSADLGSTQ